MAGIKFDITGDNQHFINAMNGVQNSVHQTAQMVESSGASIENMFNRIAGAAGLAFSTATIKSFTDKVRETRMYFQDIESSMEVFLGSQEKAAAFTKRLKDYAYYNMFEFSDLAAASKQMIAYHTAVDDVIPELDKLSNIATGTKQPLMELVSMYNNARSIGYIQTQQLGMWARQGILVKETLKEMGEEVKKGGVSFEQLQKVIDKYTGEGGMFHNLMANQMENISAEAGQLADTLDLMYDEIGRKYQDVFVKGYKAASEAAEGFPEIAEPVLDAAASGAEFLIDHYKEIGSILIKLITTYGVYKAALVATNTVEGAIHNMQYKNEVAELESQIAILNDIKGKKDEIISQDLLEYTTAGKLTEENAKQLELEREKLAVRVGKGELTEDQANNISGLQTKLALLDQEHDITLKTADAKIAALKEEKAFYEEALPLFQQEAYEKQAALDLGKKKLADAKEQVDITQAILEKEQQIAAITGQEVDSSVKDEAADALETYEQLKDAINLDTLAEQANTAAEQVNTAQTEINTLQNNINTVSQQRNAVATSADTVAIEQNTLATRLGSAATAAWTKTQQIFAVAVGQVKNAFNGLKAAIMTNPLGVLIGAITLALPYIMEFFQTEEDATAMQKRFGDTADEAASKVKSLYGTLQTASSGSQLYEKTVQDLLRTCQEYGVITDDEAKNLDTLEKKVDAVREAKEKLIEVIKTEAIERQAAEATANAQEAYDSQIEKIKGRIKGLLSDQFDEQAKNTLVDVLLDDDDLAKIKDAQNKIRDYAQSVEDLKKQGRSDAEILRGRNEIYREYQGVLSEVTEKARKVANEYGLGEPAVRSFYDALDKNSNAIWEAGNTLDETTEKIEKARGAGIAALDEVTRKNYYAKKSLGDIKDELDKIIARKNINIDINISYNEKNPMPDVLKNLTSEELKNRAAYFTSQLQGSSWGMKNVKDPNTGASKIMTDAEIAEQTALALNQANIVKKQEEAAAKEAERKAEEAKKNAEKYAKARAAALAKEKQQAQKHTEDMVKLERDAERAREDARIAGIKSAAERERAEREAQHKRTIEDIKRQEEDIYKKIYQDRKTAYENANKGKQHVSPFELTDLGDPKKWNDFVKQATTGIKAIQDSMDSLDPSQLEAVFTQIDDLDLSKFTDNEAAVIRESYRMMVSEAAKANAERMRQIQEERDARIQALRDYIKEYGSIQDQRAAITAEYDKKIEDAGDAIQKASLEKQKERLLAELDMKELQESVNWEVVFNDLDKLSKTALEELKKKLRKALDAKDITAENAKVLSEKILEIENRISDKTDIWGSMIPALKERRRLVNEVLNSEKEIEKLQDIQNAAVVKQDDALKNFTDIIGISPENFKQQFGEINAESLKTIESFYNIDNASQEVKDAFANLQVSTTNLSEAQEQLTVAQKNGQYVNDLLKQMSGKGADGQNFGSAIKSIFTNAVEANGGGFMGVASLVQTNVNSLADFTEKVGLAGTEFGDGVHEFADGVNGFMSAIKSLASGDVLGAVNGIVDGLQGYGHLIERIGGFSFSGSNAEEVRSKDDELIRANESLELQMAKLTEKMEDANGLSALRLAEERKQNQTQYQQNIMDRWANDMGYHDAHHSNSYYWNLSDEITAQINEVLSDMGSNRRIRGNVWEDLTQLTPEELDEIRTNASRAWDAIKDQGDYDWVYDALEEYADQAGKLADITEETYEKMSGMSKTALYDDFLNNLSAMVESSEDAFADIENGWQKMINNMVINNIIAAKYQEELEKWRQSVATATQNRTDGTFGDEEYKARLEELRNELLDIYGRAGKDIEDFTEAGIIKPIEEAADKSEEAVNTLTESIRSAFNSLAADTRQDIEEWGSNLRNAIIETYVTNEILGEEHEKWVKLWVERVNALYESLNSGLIGQGEFDARMLALDREFNKYTTDIVARIDSMKQTLGYAFDEAANSIDNLAGTLLDNLLSTSEDAGDIGKEIAGNLIREMLQTLLASEKYASQIEAIKVKWSAYLKEAMDYDAWDADWQRRYEEAMNAGNPGEREARMKKLEEEREKELERRRNAVKDVTQDVEKLNEAIANDEAIESLVDQYKELSDAAKSSFGDMHDSFMDAVTDMENGAENLRKKLNETLVKDLIEKNVFNVPLTVTIDGKETEFEKGFDEYQEDWTRRYLEIYNDTELSAEQRENLLQALIDELMNTEENMAKAAEELAGKLKDAQTDTTFKDMADSWQSALMDMEMTADEFAENVRQTMAKKIIDEFLLGSSFKDFLNQYQDTFNQIMAGDGTMDEKIASLLPMIDQWVAKYEELAPLAEKIREAFGITGDAQSAFSDLRSAFVSALTDMEGDAEDFRDSLEKILVRDLIEKLVLDVPITVRIDGEDKVFDSFNEYSGDWNKRYLDGMKELQEAKKALDDAQAGSDRKAVADAEARYAAASAYIDALIDELVEMEAMTAEAAEQFKEQMKKAQKDTTFTDMESNFVDALMDMEGSVEDFANDLKKTIVQRLLEAFMVSEQIKPLLDDLQNTFNAAMADTTLTNEERAKMIAEGYTDDEGIAHKGIDDVAGTLSPLKEVVNGLLEAIGYVGKEAETVFSNLGDTIRDSLMDAGSGVENFMEKLTETIISSLVDSYMATEDFQNGLQKVKDELTSALNDVAEAQRAVEEARKKVAEAKTDEEIAAANRELEKANGQLEAANQNLADAKQNASDFYTEAEKGTEEWRKAMESLRRDTTFKDMTDDWVSNLMDFNATAEDWAEEIGRTMAQRIIEQMIVPTMIQPLMQNIQDVFNRVMAENTTEDAEGNAVYNWEGVLGSEELGKAIADMESKYPELKELIQRIMGAFGVKPDDTFSNSLDSLSDTLLDHLLSLDDDVEDIGKKIGATLVREMLEQMLATGPFAEKISDIRQMWQNILTGNNIDENGNVLYTMETVLTEIADLEKELSDPDKSGDFAAFMEKYREYTAKAKEGFSDLRGAFVSTLTGMESDAETFGRKIGVTMLQQMIDAYVDKTYSEQMAAINQEWAEALESGNTEALDAIKEKVIQLYESIGNDDVAQQLADSINELERQLDTTFSGMAGDWTSALMDMNGSASDWGKVIGRTLAQKIISEMIVGKQLQPYLDKIQEAYNNAISQEGATAESVANSMKPFIEEAEKAGEGVKDIVETIMDAFGLIEESNPFDSLRSSFVSALMDMENDTEDFAHSIGNLMTQDFIDKFVLGEEFDKRLVEWQQQYESIMGGNYSEEDRIALLNQLKQAIAAAKEGYAEEAAAIHELMGTVHEDQTATVNMADKATYDQFELFLGMQTAQLMNAERQTSLQGQILATLQGMRDITSPDGNAVREMRNMLGYTNEYLLDIKGSNREILSSFGSKLDQIITNLSRL